VELAARIAPGAVGLLHPNDPLGLGEPPLGGNRIRLQLEAVSREERDGYVPDDASSGTGSTMSKRSSDIASKYPVCARSHGTVAVAQTRVGHSLL